MSEPTPPAPAEERAPNPAPLAVLAFLAPWTLVSVLLPAPWRWYAVACVAALALLLLAAASWSHRAATKRGLDATHWAFATVLTLGVGMLVLALRGARRGVGRFCYDCGRDGDLDEPFCFGCGSAS